MFLFIRILLNASESRGRVETLQGAFTVFVCARVCACDTSQLSPVPFLSASRGFIAASPSRLPLLDLLEPSLPTTTSFFTHFISRPSGPLIPPKTSVLVLARSLAPSAALLCPSRGRRSSTLLFSILLCLSFLL